MIKSSANKKTDLIGPDPLPKFYAGTSGLVLPVPNKQHYPPEFREGSRLSYYASLCNSIEINSSFYKIPLKKTTASWEASVPENFSFSFKIYKEISHKKELEFDESMLARFMDSISGINVKKGALLLQLPPGTALLRKQLQKLLKKIIKEDPQRSWKLNVEFRNPSWYTKEIFSLLTDLQVGLVIHDIPKSITPSLEPWTDFVYLRFHGVAGDYRGSYNIEQLEPYSKNVHVWLKNNKTVFVYFNNTIGEAFSNLQSFRILVESSALKVKS